MKEYEYKVNGAGDVFRKHGKNKSQCFYRGAWRSYSWMNDVWDFPNLKPITEKQAYFLIDFPKTKLEFFGY